MYDIIRDSTFGYLLNRFSNGKYAAYPEERQDFVIPERFSPCPSRGSRKSTIVGTPSDKNALSARSSQTALDQLNPAFAPAELEKATGYPKPEQETEVAVAVGMPESDEPYEYLVEFGPDDPDNPQNWSKRKRNFVAFSISLLTFGVYIGSAIYVPSIPGIMEEFKVSQVVAILGLTLFVFAYGVFPMILSPLQELASLGRNPVYIIGFFLFAIFQIPIVLAKNIGTILAFRFLAGAVGSPALATGGASMGDIFPPEKIAYAISVWAAGAVCGPITGPVIGGFAAQKMNWRWPNLELLWISWPIAFFLFFTLPETLPATILKRRAQRLRKLTGNNNIKSQSELDEEKLTPKDFLSESLLRPFVLTMEPAVFFTNFYLALVYACFYLWFESFPLVFEGIYHFNLGLSQLPFLAFIVSALLTLSFYFLYQSKRIDVLYAKHGADVKPEIRLEIAFIGSFFIPISLFFFGWASRPSVHWIAPVIAGALYLPGIFLIFQGILVYLATSYPKYAASVLAGNDAFRSSVASVFPLFGSVFFRHLGLGPASSLLGGVSILMIPILYLLMSQGWRLRARSKYAQS